MGTPAQLAELINASHPGAFSFAMNDKAQLAKLSPTGTWRRGAFEARHARRMWRA